MVFFAFNFYKETARETLRDCDHIHLVIKTINISLNALVKVLRNRKRFDKGGYKRYFAFKEGIINCVTEVNWNAN